jgi:hypothetical protein
MRAALVAALVAFLGIEAVLIRWAVTTLTLDQAIAQLEQPMPLIMLTDFSFFAGIVFFWIVGDARKRGRNGWVWLPGIILAPTAALVAYVLLRPAKPSE